MLQVNIIRQNPQLVKERLEVKHFKDVHLVDEVLKQDDRRRKLTFEFDETKAKINAASKEIGALMSKGEREVAEQRKRDVEALKNDIEPILLKLKIAEERLHEA